MLALTFTEENYLKAIYSLQLKNAAGEVSVNEIADKVQTRPATVTDMLRKLSDKELIHYERYKKIQLTKTGTIAALNVVRKHRLWETFLHVSLHFSWDEVHEVAEQLEHIHSQQLIDRLDSFLGFPEFDPHGHPIPKPNGDIPKASTLSLNEVTVGVPCKIVAVKDTSTEFLLQLRRFHLQIGSVLTITERMPYDNSLTVTIGKDTVFLSEKIALNLIVV
jgi:DtxR family Mn-dependent transcriptional regulator